MSYALTTFGQLITQLSLRLSDPNYVFWNKTELQAYLTEALRTWQAFSQFYSTKSQFSTTAGTFMYDLYEELPELTPTITDREVIEDIQRFLQEPVNGTAWTGTEQFTYDQVVQAIANRRDRFMMETGLTNSISEVAMSPPTQGVLALNNHTIQVRRAMWKNLDGMYSLLWLADEYSFLGTNPTWSIDPGLPTDYSTALQQPLSLQVSPPPADLGSVNLITVESGSVLDPANTATVLGIPDDFVWVVKFGALSDLFSTSGPGSDPARAEYCESRWTDGIQLARITNFVELGQQNGVPSFIDSMEELDNADPSWVSSTPGPPSSLVVSGNIAAVSPIPDTGPYSLLFDITPKMIIPTKDEDFVQVGQEFIDIILDYAQHLSSIKVGIEEIKSSFLLYKNFATVASVENDVLRAGAGNFDILSNRSNRGAHENPRRKSDITLGALT